MDLRNPLDMILNHLDKVCPYLQYP